LALFVNFSLAFAAATTAFIASNDTVTSLLSASVYTKFLFASVPVVSIKS
jgi:hypothetical protein